MNLNDPKQKELLARYRQQLLAQYQKQMRAAAAAKAGAQNPAATATPAPTPPQQVRKPAPAPVPTPAAMTQQAPAPVPASAAVPQTNQPRRMSADMSQSAQAPKVAPSPSASTNSVAATPTAQATAASSPTASSEELVNRLDSNVTPQQATSSPQKTAPSPAPTVLQEAAEVPTANANVAESSARPAVGGADSSVSAGGERKKRTFGEMRDGLSTAKPESFDLEMKADGAGGEQATSAMVDDAPSGQIDGDGGTPSPAKKRARFETVAEESKPTDQSMPTADNSVRLEEVAELQAKVDELTSEASTLKKSNAELSTKLDGKEEAVTKATEETSTLKQQTEELSEKLRLAEESSAKETENHAAEVERLTGELTTIRQDTEKAAANHAAEIERLNSEMAAQREDAERNAAELTAEIEKMVAELNAMREENANLAAGPTDVDGTIASLRAELRTAQESFADLEQTSNAMMEEVTTDIAAKSIVLSEKSARITELESKIAELNAELNARAAEMTPLTAENKSLKDELSDLQAQLTTLSHGAAKARENHKLELKQKEAMILSLGGSLAELRAKVGACECTKSEDMPEIEIPLEADPLKQAEKEEIESAVRKEVEDKMGERLQGLETELQRIRDELASTIVERDDFKSKFETARSEYKTEIAALGNSYEEELESLKQSVSQSGSVNGDMKTAMCDDTPMEDATSIEIGESASTMQTASEAAAAAAASAAADVVDSTDSKETIAADIAPTKEQKGQVADNSAQDPNVHRQCEERIAEFERKVTEKDAKVDTLESALDAKRAEIRRLHAQIAVFSAPDKENVRPSPPLEQAADGPISLTVRRLRQWIGGVELKFDSKSETLAEFSVRAARALHMPVPVEEMQEEPPAPHSANEDRQPLAEISVPQPEASSENLENTPPTQQLSKEAKTNENSSPSVPEQESAVTDSPSPSLVSDNASEEVNESNDVSRQDEDTEMRDDTDVAESLPEESADDAAVFPTSEPSESSEIPSEVQQDAPDKENESIMPSPSDEESMQALSTSDNDKSVRGASVPFARSSESSKQVQQPKQKPAASFVLRRPGTEAQIFESSSLRSFDVVYVTSPAEEALFHAVTSNSGPVVCG